jgi:hypothetical protein
MKTLFLSAAVAVVLALSAAPARAQHHGHIVPAGGCSTCPSGHLGGHFGGHIGGHSSGWKLSGLFGGKLFGGIFCNHGSLFGKDSHGGGAGLFGGGPQIPVVDPRMGGNAGQLVFPQHPFVRGPRDYFMLEDR